MADFGGVMRFTYNGSTLVIRAKVEMEPTDDDFVEEDNQDGSFDRYAQPKGPKWDLEFVDSTAGSATSQPWNAIMKGGPYNFTLSEDDNGILHTIANGKFIGRPKIDRLKGIVTGITLKGSTGSYKQTTTG